jgi:N-acetyl-gamma-glutamyl-phosphate reductase
MSIPVGVAGFRGYSGAELVAILEKHSGVKVVLLEHRSDSGERPRPRGFAGPPRIACTAEAVREAGLAAVFLATPHEVSMELVPAMLEAEAKVIDLSGAFRLKTSENYKRWYKEEHAREDLLAEAVYGLPEFYRDTIAGARLVANPGCYPTAANLALRPLVESGVCNSAAPVICDAKSGVSGAGRKPSLKTSFCEVTENFSAYAVLEHRHVPEVLLHSGLEESQFSFTAQLLPVHRGILETIYVQTPAGTTSEDLLAVYVNRYGHEPFVRLYDAGSFPDLVAVQKTNYCDIGVKAEPSSGRAVVVSAIDNLGKGAAGQAVQNMNLMLGFPETEGLL